MGGVGGGGGAQSTQYIYTPEKKIRKKKIIQIFVKEVWRFAVVAVGLSKSLQF